MNFARSTSLSLKYKRFTPSDCKDTGIRKVWYVTKDQFLCKNILDFLSADQTHVVSLEKD